MFKKVYNLIEQVLEEVEVFYDVVDYNLGEDHLNINVTTGEQFRVPYAAMDAGIGHKIIRNQLVGCERCGETYDLNILTGECFSCGVDKYNDPLISSRIRDVKLTPDLMVRGKIIDGETRLYVLNKEGVVLARGWK